MAKREKKVQQPKVRAARPTRADKIEYSFKTTGPLQPLNQTQAEYIMAIESRPFIIATGYAGTSKTYIPTRIACKWLKQRAIEKIVIARPAASMSESLGFFKGTAQEKMKMWIGPVLSTLKEEYSPGQLEYLMSEEVEAIVCVPLETIKGSSFKNCFIIVDEAEDCTLKEVVSLLTRLGTNSTMVLAGDISQVDIKRSGIGEFLQLRDSNQRLSATVDWISFDDYDDIVRSEAVREIIIGMDEVNA